MAYFDRQQQAATHAGAIEVDAGLRAYLLQIYNYMASALVLTGLVAYFASTSDAFMQAMTQMRPDGTTGLSPLAYIVMFAPLGVVIYLSVRIHAMSQTAAQAWFWAFSTLMGLSLYWVFQAFTGESITRVFFITAGTFGAMSLYGYTTKRDLTGMGSFLIMGVIGILIASIVNLFLASSALGFAISVIGVLCFVGLTAYDTQKLKHMYYTLQADGAALQRMAIMGALNLYLDFLNLFLMLLRLFGERR